MSESSTQVVEQIMFQPSSKVLKVVKWIQKKGKNENDKKENGQAHSLAFIDRGKQYSFYCSTHQKYGSMNFLSVWVRPVGTTSNSKLDTFSDTCFDGMVNSGSGGNPKQKKRFWDELDSDKTGLEFRDYWQKRYDAAIDVALRHMK